MNWSFLVLINGENDGIICNAIQNLNYLSLFLMFVINNEYKLWVLWVQINNMFDDSPAINL